MYFSTLSLRDGHAAPVLYSWSGYATYNHTADVASIHPTYQYPIRTIPLSGSWRRPFI